MSETMELAPFGKPEGWYDDLPRPIYWRVMVKTQEAQQMTKGGIALPTQAQDAEDVLNYIGKVMSMGALATKHERLQGESDQPKIGDWVMYGRYAGQTIHYKGEKFLVLNDDEILGIVPNPSAIKIYV